MLRTNSKIVKKRIHQHIFDKIYFLLDDYNKKYDKTLKGCVECFTDNYCSYVNSNNNYKKIYSADKFRSFCEYMQALPFDFYYYFYDMRMFLKCILEETEEEAEKFTTLQVQQKYYYLIYREILSLQIKFKVGVYYDK